MLARISAVTLNTYREAVRARILLGLFALAMASAGYSIIVGEYASKNSLRIISDVGSFSLSVFGIVVAILLGATSLYRELELKTVFPILARPLRRSEYLVGKYLGAVLTLLVFVAAHAGVLLLCLQFMVSDALWVAPSLLLASSLPLFVVGVLRPDTRTWLPIVWAGLVLGIGWFAAADAALDRMVVVSSALLALLEVSIVTALATLFSSFSSPFLTAVFTFGVFLVGRSADALAKLPPRVFGQPIADFAAVISRMVPNLMVYVPPRTLLMGQSPDVGLTEYLGLSALQAMAWCFGLLVIAALLFQRRDFV